MKRRLYTIAQWTWGLPQTLIGSAVYLMHRKDHHFDYNGARVTVWDKDSGVSLGKFIFVPSRRRGSRTHEEADRFLIDHEYGHTIQSLILGPAYLLLVGAPSLAWNRLPYFARKRKKTGRSYYSAVFERTANTLGKRISARAGKAKSK